MDADIRTAAQRMRMAAEEHLEQGAHFSLNDPSAAAFIDGAAWAQSRVTPTREQVMDELRRHKLVHVSVSRKSAFCTCNSSVKAGTDANLEWFESHRADAILALLAGLAEGESSE